ncbi:MAG: HAMP domain-containing histidine kinase [Clostridia bacterium]|nr:HAMP domain-containing histidine kinase [Clostridia bacterium]
MKSAFCNFDKNSIKFRLWVYFIIFATLLMLVLWFLQIFFLNNYYQEMKISAITQLAQEISDEYGSDDFSEKVLEESAKNDIFIHVENTDGTVIYTPSNDTGRRFSYMYVKEMGMVKNELAKTGSKRISLIIPEPGTEANTLAYARILDDKAESWTVLYIFSPLYPVTSTVDILTVQLGYVTVISLVLACLISFYLSRRISKPIRKITENAEELAVGNYGIIFQGGAYSEIKNLADTLTYVSLQLEKADTQQKDLIANVSHDLRTPLTMVKSYAEMIRDLSGDNPEKRKAHLQVIIDEADRLNLLVNDLLMLSRMQSGVVTVSKERIELGSLTRSIVASYDILAEQDGYVFETDCDGEFPVFADEQRIRQVISNLVNNAVKYCGEDKKIRISLKEKHGNIRCEVADNGMGIAPEELDRVWNRYYKASTNHVRTTSGTGLGLSIVREILCLHGAEYGVESTPGEGSTFWFELEKCKQ